jgi:NADH-quinone oxidoreductase subunit E/NADP-reducing hydrogenase subunit HndA
MKGNILIVDDEQIVLKSCERILKPEGYDVDTSISPSEALRMLQRNRYDLLITDIKMPGMDGLEFTRRAKTMDPDINVVFITGYPSQENIQESVNLSAFNYIMKPFSPVILTEVTEKAMKAAKKEEALQPEMENYTEEVRAKLNDTISHYRNKPGSLIPVLQEAQELVGFLPPSVQRHIAKGMNIPVSTVHGVVSFYSFFTMKPKGKNRIRVCLGTACYVKRAEEILEKLKEHLKIGVGEVTEDKNFSIDSVRCLGACGLAPVVVVNKDTYGSINPVKTLDILKEYE